MLSLILRIVALVVALTVWMAHQHVQANVGGVTVYSGSVLALLLVAFLGAAAAVFLAILRGILRELRPVRTV